MTIEPDQYGDDESKESLGRFDLGNGQFLSVFANPRRHDRSRRMIFFETTLAIPLQLEQEVAERAHRIYSTLHSGAISSSDKEWLSSLLKGIYFNLRFTSTPSWDLRAALSIPVTRGRPPAARARDLYLALYVRFGQASGTSLDRAVEDTMKDFALGDSGDSKVEHACKTWKHAKKFVENLLDKDEAIGIARADSIRDYQRGLTRVIWIISSLQSGNLPGVEDAALSTL